MIVLPVKRDEVLVRKIRYFHWQASTAIAIRCVRVQTRVQLLVEQATAITLPLVSTVSSLKQHTRNGRATSYNA